MDTSEITRFIVTLAGFACFGGVAYFIDWRARSRNAELLGAVDKLRTDLAAQIGALRIAPAGSPEAMAQPLASAVRSDSAEVCAEEILHLEPEILARLDALPERAQAGEAEVLHKLILRGLTRYEARQPSDDDRISGEHLRASRSPDVDEAPEDDDRARFTPDEEPSA